MRSGVPATLSGRSNPTSLAVWFLVMGAVGIYAGVVLVGWDIVWRRLLETVA